MVLWYERMNTALDYIEEHLLDKIDLQVVAKLACCSVSSFQRTFSIIAEQSLSDYIRRRKLSLAVIDLQQSSTKIIDIALKYGYESPEAFTRAFNHVHGISPTQARVKGTELTAFPRISFLLTIKGAIPMNYRIEQLSNLFMVGMSSVFSTTNDEHLTKIPQMWLDGGNNEKFNKFIDLSKQQEPLFAHLSPFSALCEFRTDINPDEMSYMIGLLTQKQISHPELTTIAIPTSTWAVFKTELHTIEDTSKTIQKLIQRVFTEWLPNTNIRKQEGFDMELYYKQGDHYYSEYWLRVDQN